MAGVPPFMMNYEQFRQQTTPKQFFKRGRSSLVNVDAGLQAWKNSAIWTVTERCKHLVKLLKAIRVWEETKSKKTTTNANERRTVVQALGNQAFALLQYHEFERRKAGGASQNVRGLGAGYQNERQAYVASGKTSAPSGKAVHGILQVADKLGLSTTKTFEQLTVQEFSDIARNYGEMTMEGYSDVHFMKKNDRVKRLIFIEDGYLWETGEDDRPRKLNTKVGAEFMYAMDAYGNLFGQDSKIALDSLLGPSMEQLKGFNHSSFNAGKDVISAGTIRATAGRLREVTNFSGHYKPDAQNVANMLGVLKSSGVDLFGGVTVKIMASAPGGRTVINTYNIAQQFVANPARVPDAVQPM